MSHRAYRKQRKMKSASPEQPTSEPPATYSDDELRGVYGRTTSGADDRFPLDFTKLWVELGYSTKSNAVAALAKYKEGR
jgi:hypothetical protein